MDDTSELRLSGFFGVRVLVVMDLYILYTHKRKKEAV